MPDKHATPLGPNGECSECGTPHVRNGKITCRGHVWTDRSTYVKGQPRARLPHPKPCMKFPGHGLHTCGMHGSANDVAVEAGKQRDAEAKAEAAVIRKLGESGTPVVDPIGKLCAIAGRAVEFMEALGTHVDAGDAGLAEIVVYGRSIKDAAGVVESIIRMGIAERLAKQDADLTSAVVAFLDTVLRDLGHNPRDPEVAGVVARHLQLIA
jgi:hypothetical protein